MRRVEVAVETDDPLTTDPDARSSRVVMLLESSQTRFEAGDVDGAIAAADAAIAAATTIGLDREVPWGLVRRASALSRQGDHEGCLAACAEATARFTALDDSLGIARGLSLAAVVLIYTGRMQEGMSAAVEAMANLERVSEPSLDLAATHCNLGSVQLFLGDHSSAEEHDRTAVEIARKVGAHREALGFQSQAIARVVDSSRRDWQAGLEDEARAEASGMMDTARAALAESMETDNRVQQTVLRAYLAWLLLRTERATEAIEVLDGVAEAARDLGQPQMEGLTLLTLGGALRELGRFRDAGEQLEAALRHARNLDFHGMQADAHFERALLFEAMGWHRDALAEHRRFHRQSERVRRTDGARRASALGLRTAMHIAKGEHERQQIEQLSRLVDELWSQSRQLARASLEDPLTNLPNRRQLDVILDERTDDSNQGRWLCVAMIDIDDFKLVNDRFGHLAGDEVLRSVAQAMRRHFRERDLAARFGGDEFAVLFMDVEPSAALQACERFRLAVAATDWSAVRPGLRVTVSVGIAACNDTDAVRGIVAAADRALYEAKNSGRDRVHLAL